MPAAAAMPPPCGRCGVVGHVPRECPQLLTQAEQAELSMRQTHPIPTQWGIVLDPKLRLTRPDPGFPAADSGEFAMLVGWTLMGVNGRAVKNDRAIHEMFTRPAKPGETLTLHCRSPLPDDDPNDSQPPCADWRKGLCQRGELCKFAHAPTLRGVESGEGWRRRGVGAGRPKPPTPAAPVPPTSGAPKPPQSPASPAQGALPGDLGAKLRAAMGGAADRAASGGPLRGQGMPGPGQGYAPIGTRPGTAPPRTVGRGRAPVAPTPAASPSHPIGMSKAEADAEQLLENAAKRQRVGDKDGDAQVQSQMHRLMQQVQNELATVRRDLQKEYKDRDVLQAKLGGYEKIMHEHQQKARALAEALRADQQNDELQRKLEKYKAKIEKLKDGERAREVSESQQRKRALQQGIEHCSDEDAVLLADSQSNLGLNEAWQILGIPSGTPHAANHAKKLMAKLHPDRVAVEVCKVGLRMRFQLVQHARDMIAPTQPDD
eukprot:TRINITY_DN47742_c0_g1_i1.p1 TRINITY_DN47742_c0_g1~~TRINITY_DN47742_c0_g1_i1.p1  ORF type:complete len:537 (+),score=117.53 TRINITY_DN47742_c0_g1_i1:148-1611(+)